MFYGRLVLHIKYRLVYFILKTFLKTLFHKIHFFLSMLSVITVFHYEKHKRCLRFAHNARENIPDHQHELKHI